MTSPRKRLLQKKSERAQRKNLKKAKTRPFIRRDPYKLNRGVFDDHMIYNSLPEIIDDVWNNVEVDHFAKFNALVFANGSAPELFERYESEFRTWKEATTDNNWVMKILDLIGWGNDLRRPQEEFKEDGTGNRYVPDYILFKDEDASKHYSSKVKKLTPNRLKKTIQLPLEVKYWGRILQDIADVQKERINDEFKGNRDFRAQIYKYSEITESNWGILTDGKVWRLYHTSNKLISDDRYFEIDLGKLCEDKLRLTTEESVLDPDIEYNFKIFFLLFSPIAFMPYSGKETLLDFLFDESKDRSSLAEDNLGLRFLDTVNIIANSIDSDPDNLSVDEIRELAEFHVFSILFTLYCESRNILPMHIPQYRHEKSISIFSEIIPDHFDPLDTIDGFWEDDTYPDPKGFEVFARLCSLYDSLATGTNGKGNGFYVNGFLSNCSLSRVRKYRINNFNMYRVLYNLLFVLDENYAPIPVSYSRITPEQLGSIYESMLEYKIERADQDMVFCKKGKFYKWEPVKREKMNPQQTVRTFAGELFLAPDNEDRKTTGSYYTPDYIVEDIVKNSISGHLNKNACPEDILALRICDPATGSGHFLNAVINYLYPKLMESYSREPEIHNHTPEECKQIIADKCVFGVDVNPNAVRLAKYSVWLNLASKGRPLKDLKDNILIADSLLSEGFWEEFSSTRGIDGFDVIVGNPPYYTVGKGKGQKSFPEETIQYFKTNYPAGSQYKINYFSMFTELSLRLLKKGGTLGYILPSTFLYNQYFNLLRAEILKCHITEVSWLDYKVFNSAETGGNCIVVVSRSKPKQSEFNCSRVNSKAEFESRLTSRFPYETAIEYPYSKITCRPKEAKVFLKILKRIGGSNLQMFGEFYNGIKTGDNKKFVSNTRKSKLHREALTGSDVFALEEPKAEQFVLFDPEKLWSNTNEEFLTFRPKILVRQTSDKLIATVELEGTVFMDTVHSIRRSWKSDDEPWRLTYFLNSKLANWLYQQLSPESGRVFAEVKIAMLKELPFSEEIFSIQLPKGYNTHCKKKSEVTKRMEVVEHLLREKFSLSQDEIDLIYGDEKISNDAA